MELLNVNTVIVPLLMGLMGLIGVVMVQSLVAANRMQKALDAHRETVEGALAGIRSGMDGLRSEMGTLRSEMGTLRAEMGGLQAEMGQMRTEVREDIAKVDGKVEYLTSRVNALQSDVSYIRGRMHITDDQLSEGSKVKDSPAGSRAQPSAVETAPPPLAVQA